MLHSIIFGIMIGASFWIAVGIFSPVSRQVLKGSGKPWENPKQVGFVTTVSVAAALLLLGSWVGAAFTSHMELITWVSALYAVFTAVLFYGFITLMRWVFGLNAVALAPEPEEQPRSET